MSLKSHTPETLDWNNSARGLRLVVGPPHPSNWWIMSSLQAGAWEMMSLHFLFLMEGFCPGNEEGFSDEQQLSLSCFC